MSTDADSPSIDFVRTYFCEPEDDDHRLWVYIGVTLLGVLLEVLLLGWLVIYMRLKHHGYKSQYADDIFNTQLMKLDLSRLLTYQAHVDGRLPKGTPTGGLNNRALLTNHRLDHARKRVYKEMLDFYGASDQNDSDPKATARSKAAKEENDKDAPKKK